MHHFQLITPTSPRKVQRLYRDMSDNDEILKGEPLQRLTGAIVHAKAGLFGAERLDANETALLEHMLRLFGPPRRTEYGVRKGRLLVPSDGGFPSGITTWGYSLTDERGQAGLMANLANDFPSVEVSQGDHTFPIRPWGLGYSVSFLDMQKAAFSGVPFETQKIRAVGEGFDDLYEELAGGQKAGFTGLFNNPNVPTSTVQTGTGGGVTWGSTKTAEEVAEDVTTPYRAIRDITGERYMADTLVLPTAKLDYLQDTYIDINGTNVRLLDEILRRCPGITSVDSWRYLDTAGAGSTAAGFLYRRSVDSVMLKWREAVALAPFQKNGAMVHNYLVEAGAVVFEKPLTAHRFDGI